jgi:hypothetical protein
MHGMASAPHITTTWLTRLKTLCHLLLQVPVTINTYYTCNKVTSEDNTMIIQTNGVLNAIDSNLPISYGPQYPLNPLIVWPQADATCASNPTCASYGFPGNCCPDDTGVYNACECYEGVVTVSWKN